MWNCLGDGLHSLGYKELSQGDGDTMEKKDLVAEGKEREILEVKMLPNEIGMPVEVFKNRSESYEEAIIKVKEWFEEMTDGAA